MLQVRHRHLMKMEFVVRCDNFVAICMPLCSRGSLAGMTPWLTPQQVQRFFLHIACALRYLHKHRIVHGDLKPHNVFVDSSDNAILGDFGHSRFLPRGRRTVTTWGGTVGYQGPEFTTRGAPFDPFLMDAYSLGVTLWVMVFRCKPSTLDDLLHAVETCRVPDMERFVLTKLLQKAPQHRHTVSDILAFMCKDEKLKVIIDSL